MLPGQEKTDLRGRREPSLCGDGVKYESTHVAWGIKNLNVLETNVNESLLQQYQGVDLLFW